MERKIIQALITFSLWLLLTSIVAGIELVQVPEQHLLDTLESFDTRNIFQKRDCDPGYFSCGNDFCAPNGATCCPNSIFYAAPGEYCCEQGGSCPNGETCLDCTPVGGSSGNGGTTQVNTPTITSPPASPSTTTIAVYSYYTFTITYYYFSWYYYFDTIIQLSTTTSTRITTTTTVQVYATDSVAAESSVDQVTSTMSFYTPPTATNLTVSSATQAQSPITTAPSATFPATTFSTGTATAQFSAVASKSQIGEGFWIFLNTWIFMGLMDRLVN